MRVVAIGDSIAYGVGDHPRSAGDISWSGRLARMAGSDDHRIFGYPGAMLKDMRSIQVPALKLVQPDLVLVSIGGNDAVRTGFNAEVCTKVLLRSRPPVPRWPWSRFRTSRFTAGCPGGCALASSVGLFE